MNKDTRMFIWGIIEILMAYIILGLNLIPIFDDWGAWYNYLLLLIGFGTLINGIRTVYKTLYE